MHDRVEVAAGCGATLGSRGEERRARVGPLSWRLTVKREDVGARLWQKRHVLICGTASSENYAVSRNQRSVLMGPVVERTEALPLRRRNGYPTTPLPLLVSSAGSAHPSHSPTRPSLVVSCLARRSAGTQLQPCNAALAIVAGADVARRLGQGTQPARASQRQHPARGGGATAAGFNLLEVWLDFPTSSKPVDCLALWESAGWRASEEDENDGGGGGRCGPVPWLRCVLGQRGL